MDNAREMFDLNEIFIARERQIEWFETKIDNWLLENRSFSLAKEPEDAIEFTPSPRNRIDTLVVLLFGRGGLGKTTLLNRYHRIASKKNWLVVGKIIDWEISAAGKTAIFSPSNNQSVSPIDYFNILCLQLAGCLARRLAEFKNYQRSLREVEETRKKVVKVVNNLQEDDNFSWLRTGISETLVFLIREFIPNANLIIDAERAKAIKNLLGEGIEFGAEQLAILRAKITESLGSSLDDYLEPEKKLAQGLGKDLRNLSRWRKTVFFFDTYEQVDEGDSYLRLVMKASGKRVGWIIAGRNNLWSGRDLRLRSLMNDYGYEDIVSTKNSLMISFSSDGDFSIEDLGNYFNLLSKATDCHPVKEEDLFKILEVTKGIPLAVKIAAGMYLETTNIDLITSPNNIRLGEIIDIMVRRYLLHTSANVDERNRLYGLAMLRRADVPLLIASALNISDEIEKKYDDELRRLHRRYSFIFTEKEKPLLHQDVRHFLRKWLLEHKSNPEITSINKRLFTSIERLLRTIERSNQYETLRDRFEDNHWISSYLDLAEQVFWLDAREGINCIAPFLIVTSFYNKTAKQEALDICSFFSIVFDEIENTRFTVIREATTSVNDDEEISKKINSLLSLYHTSKLPTFANTIGKSYQDEIRAIICWGLGESYFVDNNNELSYQWYENAFNLLPSDDKLRRNFSEVAQVIALKYYNKSDNESAIKYYQKSYSIDSNNLFSLFRLGRVYINLGRDQDAIYYYNKVLEEEPTNALAIRGLASAYRYVNLEKSIEFAIKSTQINSKDDASFNYLGLLYRDNREFSKSIAAHEQARKIERKPTTSFFLALLYAHQKDYKLAKRRIFEANNLLKDAEVRDKIRLVWIELIELGVLIIEGNFDNLIEKVKMVKKYVNTKRIENTVIEHLKFLYDAYNLSDRFLEVETIIRCERKQS